MDIETKKITTQPMQRSFTLAREAVNVEARTVELAFSSEEPYDRWFGKEVLDHNASSIRLGRLQNGGAVLDNHDPDEQIGVVESVSIGLDKVGRAVCRFSKSTEADQIFQDIVDGIRRHVSVGYVVHKYVEETTVNGGVETTICRVMDWEPLEISVVAIPADPTVGIGRSAGAENVETIVMQKNVATQNQDNSESTNQERLYIMENEAEIRAQGVQVEQKRTADLLAIAEGYAKYGAREMVGDFIRNGKTPEQFNEAIMQKMASHHSDAKDAEIGMSKKEREQYSVIRAVQAVLSGDWSNAGLERAASEAVSKRSGFTPEGFFVPVDSFSTRAFTAGTAAEAGNLIQTSVLGNEFVDVLRNAMTMQRLGVRFLGGLTGNVAIPRKASASTIAAYTEVAAITASNPATNQISLTPKRVGGQVLYSKQALIQASMDIEAMLRDDLAQGTAAQIENYAINGTGSAPQPRGVVQTSGIGAVVGGTNGATFNWGHIVGLESACANANAEPDARAGYLVNTKTRGWLKTVQKATNLDFVWDRDPNFPLNGYRAAVTNNMVSNGTKGTASGITSTAIFASDWSDLVIGLFGGLDVVVDPYSQAGTGQVVITANQYIDVAVRLAASFAAMTDGLTA